MSAARSMAYSRQADRMRRIFSERERLVGGVGGCRFLHNALALSINTG